MSAPNDMTIFYTTCDMYDRLEERIYVNCGATKQNRKERGGVVIEVGNARLHVSNNQLNELGNLLIALSEQETDADDVNELFDGYDIELTIP